VIVEPDYGELTLRPPELTFDRELRLHLSDLTVELLHTGQPAHTTNDILVWLPEHRVLFAGDLAFNGGQPFVLEGSVAGFRLAVARMRSLAPEVLAPGHGPVCRGADVDQLLGAMDAYLEYVQQVAVDSRAAGLTPLEAAQKHADNPYAGWAETERFVGNLHRAYAELAAPGSQGTGERTRLGVPDVWPDMVAFHGGPIACHA
jgi:cyclase